jgi:hypothetical protein
MVGTAGRRFARIAAPGRLCPAYEAVVKIAAELETGIMTLEKSNRVAEENRRQDEEESTRAQ